MWDEFTNRGSIRANLWHVFKVALLFCLLFAVNWWVSNRLLVAVFVTLASIFIVVIVVKLYQGLYSDDS